MRIERRYIVRTIVAMLLLAHGSFAPAPHAL
jgi:hypothetical protein